MGATTISVEEYLSDSRYEFSEYLDGVIQDKYPIVQGEPLVSNEHSALVGLIIQWFGEHKKAWRVKAGPEATTVITPSRYRLPDVSVLPFGPMDKIQITPPLIAIEVLSPANTASEILSKLEDYEALGVANVWVIDPVTRSGFVCAGPKMTPTMRFAVQGTPIFLDLQRLFAEYDEESAPPSQGDSSQS